MLPYHSVLKYIALGLLVSANSFQAHAQQDIGAASTPQVRQFLQQSDLDNVRMNQVLGVPVSHCGHVIDLMMKNQMRARFRTDGTEQLYLPHLTVGLSPGDLELLCIHLVCDGHAQSGPTYQIGMKNNSSVPIGNFRVSLVGVLCQIDVHSPSATICIPRMEAGEETQIQIQLPVTCLSMGPCHQRCEFDTVVVALDSFDELLECDEFNNVQILKREDVSFLVIQPVQTAPVPQAPAVPAEPAPPGRPSPLDGIDLDQLDLDGNTGENEVQSLLLRR